MSTTIKTSDSLIFGHQSPFYRVITESGLREIFLHLLVDNNSKVVRKRSFKTYLLASKVFPNNTVSIHEGIGFGISQFLNTFLKSGVRNNIESIYALKPSSYIQGEITLTNELAKALKIKSVLAIVMDSQKTSFADQKGITTYITRNFSHSEDADLDVAWSNGFFAFSNPSSLSILVVIPKQYIANMLITIKTLNLENEGTTFTENIAFLEALKNEMIIDLVKSFFAAIYSDGYRHRINTDIASLNTIFQEQGSSLLTSSKDEEEISNELLTKYRHKLKKFKENDCENLIYECMKLYRFQQHVTINPYEFYASFIDIPYAHLKSVFRKIPSFVSLSNKGVQAQIVEPDFSNNLSKMNTFFEDENRDIILFGLKLIRFLPFFLFNTYIIGGGNYHNQMLQVLSNIKSVIPRINSFKNTHLLYGPLVEFIINELVYFTEVLAKQMESPLVVNNKSRHLIVNLIAQSMRILDEDL
jgi:hypothetical protein